MSKEFSARTHGKSVKARHESQRLSDTEIRSNKCQRSKQRNAARRKWREEHLVACGGGKPNPRKSLQKDRKPIPRPSGRQLHCWPLPQ